VRFWGLAGGAASTGFEDMDEPGAAGVAMTDDLDGGAGADVTSPALARGSQPTSAGRRAALPRARTLA